MGGYPARWVDQSQTVGSCKQLHVHLQALDWRMVDAGWRPDPSWQPTPVHIKSNSPWGYSLYSDDRDDRRIFKELKSAIWYFLGIVQAKSIKRIKPVSVRV